MVQVLLDQYFDPSIAAIADLSKCKWMPFLFRNDNYVLLLHAPNDSGDPALLHLKI